MDAVRTAEVARLIEQPPAGRRLNLRWLLFLFPRLCEPQHASAQIFRCSSAEPKAPEDWRTASLMSRTHSRTELSLFSSENESGAGGFHLDDQPPN